MKKKFTLKTKQGEKVFSLEAHDLYEAETMFSIIKKLPRRALCDIFIVEEVSDK